MAEQRLKGYALRYADRGWPVLPCRMDATKAPLTKHGYLDASTDPALIEEWFTRWPDANLALATGCAPKVFVIDIDSITAHGHDGYAAWARLCADNQWKEPDDALCVITPSGGMHFYFEYVDGITNARGTLPPGVDVRGQGGYVLLPPSKINGNGYQWMNNPAHAIPAPEWLIRVLTPVQQPPQAKRDPLATITPRRRGGSVIDAYNKSVKIKDALTHYGYTVDGNKFTRPDKKAADGFSGTINDVANSAYTFSNNDPAYDSTDLSPSRQGKTIRPFDLLVKLSFSGDIKAAVKSICSLV